MSLKQEGVKFSEFVQGCTEATAPEDDDYIVMDGENGTRKITAPNLVGNSLADAAASFGTATASELTSTNKLLLKVGNTMKSLPGDAVAKESDVSANTFGIGVQRSLENGFFGEDVFSIVGSQRASGAIQTANTGYRTTNKIRVADVKDSKIEGLTHNPTYVINASVYYDSTGAVIKVVGDTSFTLDDDYLTTNELESAVYVTFNSSLTAVQGEKVKITRKNSLDISSIDGRVEILETGEQIKNAIENGSFPSSMMSDGYIQSGGKIGSSTNYIHTGLLPVASLKNCTVSNLVANTSYNVWPCAFFDADNTFVGHVADTSFTIDDDFISEQSLESAVYVMLGCKSTSTISITKNDGKEIAGDYEIICPSILPSVVSHNTNICLDNIAIDATPKNSLCMYFELANANEYDEAEYIPTSAGTLTKKVSIIKNANYEEKTKSISCVNVAADAGNGLTKKVMIIGESTTDNDDVTSSLANLFASDAMKIELVGTRVSSSGYHHEGRGGWKTTDYLTKAEYNDKTNAFFNPSTSTFDFAYYLENSGVDTPDVVIINEAINDSDSNYSGATIVANLQTMIGSIRKSVPNIPIIVAMPNLASAWTNLWTYGFKKRYKFMNILKSFVSAFDGKESEHTYIAPVYLYVNALWDMRYTTATLSTRNPKEIYKGTDGVHPSAIGYAKMADCYYNSLKYVATKEWA